MHTPLNKVIKILSGIRIFALLEVGIESLKHA